MSTLGEYLLTDLLTVTESPSKSTLMIQKKSPLF